MKLLSFWSRACNRGLCISTKQRFYLSQIRSNYSQWSRFVFFNVVLALACCSMHFVDLGNWPSVFLKKFSLDDVNYFLCDFLNLKLHHKVHKIILVLIGLAVMRYQLLVPEKYRSCIKSSSWLFFSRQIKSARSGKISQLFLIKQLFHWHLLDIGWLHPTLISTSQIQGALVSWRDGSMVRLTLVNDNNIPVLTFRCPLSHFVFFRRTLSWFVYRKCADTGRNLNTKKCFCKKAGILILSWRALTHAHIKKLSSRGKGWQVKLCSVRQYNLKKKLCHISSVGEETLGTLPLFITNY